MYVSLETDDFAIFYLDSVQYKTNIGEKTSYFRKLFGWSTITQLQGVT